MEQFQITSKPRHLRHVFFVDEKYPYDKIFELINSCLSKWGGRFDPIVPVKANIVSDEWKEVLKHYDPDFVFYSNEVDPDCIKKLRIFNPCGYYNLDDQARKEDHSGVNSFYLLSTFHPKSRIILTSETWEIESPLISYFKLNYGFETSLNNIESELSKDFDRTIAYKEDFKALNQLIHERKPLNQSHFSRINLNTVILRNKKQLGGERFEIVIAKDKSSTTDLLYYWNRMLFEIRNILYITAEELDLLCKDQYFGKVLYEMDWSEIIHVTSQSLTEPELTEIIESKLKKTGINRRIEYFKVESFPYEIQDANGLFLSNLGETPTIQMLQARSGLLHLPKLSFTNKVGFFPQRWAIDIQIKTVGYNYQNEFYLPFTTDSRFIVKGVKGRINKKRNISIIIHNQQNTSDTLEIDIPEFKSLLRQLTSRPVFHGESKQTKYLNCGPHDDSNKLSAFLKAFNNDFNAIDDFFSDKFWVTVFEELIRSKKAAGDTVSFNDLMEKCKASLAGAGIVELDSNGALAGKKGETYKNEENLSLGLQSTLGELCDYRVFLRGFSLKCDRCSSKFWYHIKEVTETVNCKGCLENFQLPIESTFSYKLNDLIKNNIYRLDGSRDGNLAVIRTLASVFNKSHQSFQYSPQINLYGSPHNNKPIAEIDVICLSNGELIIGEAKHSSPAFFQQGTDGLTSLDKLIEVSKTIFPDKIILSSYEDQYDNLRKAKKYLEGKFYNNAYTPEIESILLHTPDDFHLGHHRYFYY